MKKENILCLEIIKQKLEAEKSLSKKQTILNAPIKRSINYLEDFKHKVWS